jgi:hypothetical protein
MAARQRKALARRGVPIRIAVVDCTRDPAISEHALARVVAALQKQLTRDFAPAWGIAAELTIAPQGKPLPRDAWWLALHDTSDRAADLGYHDVTPTGLPLGKAFTANARQDGMPWSVVLSHELLEMLIDPYINLAAVIKKPKPGRLYGYEVCDACRSDAYRIDGVWVSNFVYPAWFEAERPRRGERFDHMERVSAPLELRPQGYATFNDLGNKRSWRLKHAGGRKRGHPRPGTRIARRAAAPAKLKHSTAKFRPAKRAAR